jgi:glycosyltransferase involved in cell wall biosynthesis
MEIEERYQVVISSYNCAFFLKRCLESVDKIFKNKRWILVFADDASTDHTEEELQKITPNLSYDFYVIKKFPKAYSVGAAKNRALKLAKRYEKEYPIICPMDADDEMGPDRLKLYPVMKKLKASFVYGGYKIFANRDTFYTIDSYEVATHLKFAWWATLFHANLIPENGKFFREDFKAYEDIMKWWELHHKDGVEMHPVEDLITHHYFKRDGSVSRIVTLEESRKLLLEKQKIYPVPDFEECLKRINKKCDNHI